MSDMTIQIYIVETHSDKKEVENMTDSNVDATQQKYYGLTTSDCKDKHHSQQKFTMQNFLLQNVKLPNQNLKTTNKPHQEYLAFVQTSLCPLDLGSSPKKNGNSTAPNKKDSYNFSLRCQRKSIDAVDESIECCLSITPAYFIPVQQSPCKDLLYLYSLK